MKSLKPYKPVKSNLKLEHSNQNKKTDNKGNNKITELRTI
jgi:hypothetical protein